MIPARQSASAQQGQSYHQPDPALFRGLPTPSSRDQSTTNKTVFGLPAVFLGLVLSLGLVGNAALGFECDEQILGKEFCDLYGSQVDEFEKNLKRVREQANSYGWDVCNESSKTAYAAYASAYEGYSYEREGWYTISPGSCRRVLTESMTEKNYYIRVEDSNGTSWTNQEKSFCMWPPQADGRIIKTHDKQCEDWGIGSRSFERLPRGNGFIYTAR